jgi:hypothetical protein
VVQDLADYRKLSDKTDDPHLLAAVGARQGVHFVDLLNTVPPGPGMDFLG